MGSEIWQWIERLSHGFETGMLTARIFETDGSRSEVEYDSATSKGAILK
jgi:hypothetical protein